jgi:predicted DNA-binding ribbon-helix-helix protein
MKSYQGWEIESPQSNAGRWSVILNHKHSHRTHFIDLESSMTLRSVEDLIYTTIEKLIEDETMTLKKLLEQLNSIPKKHLNTRAIKLDT